MTKLSKNKIGLFVGLSILLVSYQNCADAGDFGTLVKSTSHSEFNFPVTADAGYMGFMSCSNVDTQNLVPGQGFYTVRAATDSFRGEGGIALDSTFLEQVNFEKQKRPASFNLEDELNVALQSGLKTNNAKLHFSVAYSERLHQVVLDETRDLYSSSIYDHLDFDSPFLQAELARKTDDSFVTGRDFVTEIDWRYRDTDTFNSWVAQLENVWSIGLGFTSEASTRSFQQYNRSPQEFKDEGFSGMYGRVLNVNFRENVFYNLQEKEGLQNQGRHASVDKDWTCKRLTIVRPTPSDVENGLIPPELNGDSPFRLKCLEGDDEYQPMNSIATNLTTDPYHRSLDKLLGENWYINPKQDCIVHSSYFDDERTTAKGCYSDDFTTTTVAYDRFYVDSGNIDPSTNKPLVNANYATVCYATY